jgi:cytoskeletal protein RodZ
MKKKKQKELIKKLKKLDKEIIVLIILCCVLFVGFISVLIWNFGLKSEVRELSENINTLSTESVRDFSLFVMSKVDKCEAVTLMDGDKSITVNNIQCK